MTTPRAKFRQEPELPAIPAAPPPVKRVQMTEATAKYFDEHVMLQQQNEFLRAELEEVTRELRIAVERIRLIENELHDVRNARDHMQRRCASMLTLLSSVKLLIVDGEEKWRAEAFAPIGSVQKPHVDRADAVEQLANALLPPEDNQ